MAASKTLLDLGDHDRAVLAAGAAEGDRRVALAIADKWDGFEASASVRAQHFVHQPE